MAINYFSLGKDKRMCDVVFAGSHDAGVSAGGSPTRAQRDSIEVQAQRGARFFDLRVGAFSNLRGGVKLKTFHADEKLQMNSRKEINLPGQMGKYNVKTMSLPVGGHSGQHLSAILNGAKNFVTGSTEFLVLIFSKSTNMDLVVSEIDVILGDCQLASNGTTNVNTMTLEQLEGKVVCVYTETADLGLQLASYHGHAGGNGARLQMKNLFKGGGYEDDFNGIQYYGKGGLTASVSGEKNKVDANAGLQKAKMMAGARVGNCQTLLGMVYVTATGGIGSLKSRDTKLWKSKRINPLLDIWESEDVAQNVRVRIPNNVDPTAEGSAALVKDFFPNMVMMDFVDEQRCQTIFDINTHGPGTLNPRKLSRPGAAGLAGAI